MPESSRTAAVPRCRLARSATSRMAPDILKSSDLAGLTAAYIQEQFEQYKNGNRRGARAMSMIPV